MTAEEKFERDYLVHVAQGELFWIEDADSPHTDVTWYFDNGLDPNVYIARPYADAETRMKAFIKYARAIPGAVQQIRQNLKTPMPISFVNYAIPGFKGFADYYTGDAKAAFASVKDPALQAEFDAAAKDIDIFFFGNDLGSQTGPLLGPIEFERFLLPHFQRLVTLGHDYGLKTQQNLMLVPMALKSQKVMEF